MIDSIPIVKEKRGGSEIVTELGQSVQHTAWLPKSVKKLPNSSSLELFSFLKKKLEALEQFVKQHDEWKDWPLH